MTHPTDPREPGNGTPPTEGLSRVRHQAWTVEDVQARPTGGYLLTMMGPGLACGVLLAVEITSRELGPVYDDGAGTRVVGREVSEVTWLDVAAHLLDGYGDPGPDWPRTDDWLDEVGDAVTAALLPVEQRALDADDCWDEDDSRRHGGAR